MGPFREVRVADRVREAGEVGVSGLADLEEGTVLAASLWFAGRLGPGVRGEVLDGRFSLALGPVEGRVYPGEYLLRIEARPGDQPPGLRSRLPDGAPGGRAHSTVIALGDPAEREELEAALRERLEGSLRTLHAARGLFLAQGEAALGYLRWALADLPAEDRHEAATALVERLEGRLQGHLWETLYPAWERFLAGREALFLSPVPDLERRLENLFHAYELWSVALAAALREAAGVPRDPFAPGAVMDLETARAWATSQLEGTARAMEGVFPDYRFDLERPPEVQGGGAGPAPGVFRSAVPPFELPRRAGWTLRPRSGTWPLLLEAVPEDGAVEVRLVVEAVGLAPGEGAAELGLLLRGRDLAEWPGWRIEEPRPLGEEAGALVRELRVSGASAGPGPLRVRDRVLLCPCGREGVRVSCRAPAGAGAGVAADLEAFVRESRWVGGCPLGR